MAAASFAQDISASTILEQTCSQTPTALTWPEFGSKENKKLFPVDKMQAVPWDGELLPETSCPVPNLGRTEQI